MTQQPRIIDTKLPLTWLLSTAGAIILALGVFALNNSSTSEKTQAKLDLLRADQATLILNIAKLEKRVDDRDTRTDVIKEGQYSMLRTLDALSMRLETLERAARK
jgi:Tfp pilus assembly protein PilN